MKTIAEVIALSADYLRERKIEKPRRLAEDLLAAALKMKRLDLYLQFDRPLIDLELQKMRSFLKRKIAGEPFEQIAGEVEFYGCAITVTPDVLIPRPETEILVDLIAKEVESGTLWDLCTGSGCVGLALKKAKPELNVILSDICPKALAVAQKNGEKNQLSVEVRQGDLLAPFIGQKADIVVANPPYISKKGWEGLDAGVRDFEPSLALVGGQSGLEFYERLSQELPLFLKPKAKVFFEIGYDQGEALKKLFASSIWVKMRLLKDWAGHDRFFFLETE